MDIPENSLHWAVDKWLAPSPAHPARVVRLCRSPVTGMRFVCIEAWHAGGVIAILFFRHDDGSWNVFPPQVRRPSMSAARLAA
ncbi:MULTISPECIES: hypothetical protein [unclassified Caballeronia]|uniref:hypothetical protein n=1 Tax=unclassified Caballeronia TaxID=2646786 RepID=UPI00285E1F89|nr:MULTISPECIES: hypothetical protein [unclassified Caballeronia]MDR5739466.1 hypothetical protein [Caballeronia sp. LZ016]MDR5807955.1 hypothetical protein [Caballeronia sp. LZ019]